MAAQVSTHTTLLNRLADGDDRAAWDEFHARYGELIRGFARRRGIQAADCDDLLQDVLLSLTKAMPDFRYDPSKGLFRSFLKTVVMRAIYKRFRQNAGQLSLGEIEEQAGAAEDAAIEEIWESEWRQYHLRQAMKQIEVEFSHADRTAFQHYVLAGMSPQATAELLNMTVNQVYKAKSNILKRLSEIIDQQIAEEG